MSDFTVPTILITGGSGQVGFELQRSLQGLGRIVAPSRQILDLSNFDQIVGVLRELKPTLIINPAAYTAVDRAETESDLAMRINGEAVGVLAQEARRLGAPVIHYSTDYVFDGTKQGIYEESDTTNPLNVYGVSKLSGENALREVGGAHCIFRTSWVYGVRGSNFLRTMLRVAAQQTELRVVSDQFGAPTWSGTIAALTAHVVGQGLLSRPGDTDWWENCSGVYNMTASGSTSWMGFAEAIFDLTTPKMPVKVLPIKTAEYVTVARRPMNSRLSHERLIGTFGVRPPDWLDALRMCIAAR